MQKEIIMENRLDLVGKKFGRLTVIKFDSKDKRGKLKWLCRCDCGKEKVVLGSRLKDGNTKSCGCLRIEKVKQRFTTHGYTKGKPTKTYDTWQHIIQRCTNPNDQQHKNYGGRGITVCEQWSGENGFIHFLEDMGEKPKGLSIDRIENDLGYFKENCRWATQKEQSRNQSSNHLITFNGKTQCITDWAEETGINKRTFYTRVRLGWSIEKIFNTPVRRHNSD